MGKLLIREEYGGIMLNNKTVLITGGTGSFGKQFIQTILERYSDVKKIVIFSRDEVKQYELKLRYPQEKYPQFRSIRQNITQRSV